jgi:hypothetical protein
MTQSYTGLAFKLVREIKGSPARWQSCRAYIEHSGDPFDAEGRTGDIAFWNNTPHGNCALIIGDRYLLPNRAHLPRMTAVHKTWGEPIGFTSELLVRDYG